MFFSGSMAGDLDPLVDLVDAFVETPNSITCGQIAR
jgi:hypothetical protein